MISSKSHTISKIAAKTAVRLTIVLIVLPIFIYFTKPEVMASSVRFPHPWAIAFPILLLLAFAALLFQVLKDKYSKTDFNWLLTLSGVVLSLYLILFYGRITTIL